MAISLYSGLAIITNTVNMKAMMRWPHYDGQNVMPISEDHNVVTGSIRLEIKQVAAVSIPPFVLQMENSHLALMDESRWSSGTAPPGLS